MEHSNDYVRSRHFKEREGDAVKIAVIGYSGSGKSTLAAALARKDQLPLLHLDCVHWLPGWVEQEPEREQQLVKAFMDSHSDWVIDGNYRSLLQQRRLEEADEIVFLGFNRVAAFFRAGHRARVYAGRPRPSMTDGCEEKFDGEFIRWILWDSRTIDYRRRYEAVCRQYAGKVTVIKNQRQLNAYYRAKGLR